MPRPEPDQGTSANTWWHQQQWNSNDDDNDNDNSNKNHNSNNNNNNNSRAPAGSAPSGGSNNGNYTSSSNNNNNINNNTNNATNSTKGNDNCKDEGAQKTPNCTLPTSTPQWYVQGRLENHICCGNCHYHLQHKPRDPSQQSGSRPHIRKSTSTQITLRPCAIITIGTSCGYFEEHHPKLARRFRTEVIAHLPVFFGKTPGPKSVKTMIVPTWW
jgi:hypothetical protein